MLKIGIMTDIHNNITALEAMPKLFEYENCHEIFCASDIIGTGPCPEEIMSRIRCIPRLILIPFSIV